jgi:hypothetical protein
MSHLGYLLTSKTGESTATLQKYGTTLDSLAFLVNHSYNSNTVCLFESIMICVWLLKLIFLGEDIFILYTDNIIDYNVRNYF